MAGVSFSLDTLGRRGGYTGLLQKYGAAGLISSVRAGMGVEHRITRLGRALLSSSHRPRTVQR